MKYVSFLFSLSMLSLIVMAGCKKPSDANDENEHEAINKLELIFRQPGQPDRLFVAEDPDGDGGQPPTRIDTIRLVAGQTYTVQFRALNIVNGVVRDISSAIQSQANAHEIFFVPSGLSLQIVKLDKDSRGFPVGLQSTWLAPVTGVGSVLVKLMHKTGIKGPADSPDLGHSDLELLMRTEVN